MGDSGAYFFGFVLAARASWADLKVTTVFSLFPTVLFLFLPLLDTVQVIIRRLLKRKNPLSSPGKDHLHHGLLARGLSPARTVILLLGVTLAANIVAMAVQGMSALVIVVTTVGIVVLLGVWRPGGGAAPSAGDRPIDGAAHRGRPDARRPAPTDEARNLTPAAGRAVLARISKRQTGCESFRSEGYDGTGSVSVRGDRGSRPRSSSSSGRRSASAGCGSQANATGGPVKLTEADNGKTVTVESRRRRPGDPRRQPDHRLLVDRRR